MLPSLFKGKYYKTLQINTKCHWLYTVKAYFSLISQSWGLQRWLGDADSASWGLQVTRAEEEESVGWAHADMLLPLTRLCPLLVPSSAELQGRQRGASVSVSEPSPWPHHRDKEGGRLWPSPPSSKATHPREGQAPRSLFIISHRILNSTNGVNHILELAFWLNYCRVLKRTNHTLLPTLKAAVCTEKSCSLPLLLVLALRHVPCWVDPLGVRMCTVQPNLSLENHSKYWQMCPLDPSLPWLLT